jgi:hypothetical protein
MESRRSTDGLARGLEPLAALAREERLLLVHR